MGIIFGTGPSYLSSSCITLGSGRTHLTSDSGKSLKGVSVEVESVGEPVEGVRVVEVGAVPLGEAGVGGGVGPGVGVLRASNTNCTEKSPKSTRSTAYNTT